MLIRTRALTPKTRPAVVELERRTVAHDGGRLKLEWSSLDALSEHSAGPSRLVLWTEADLVVGFIGRYAFGGNGTAELAGMVDPVHRRRGIGSRLLDAAIEETGEYGTVLLVVPRNSAGGGAFARARDGSLSHSEHALLLRGEASPARRVDAVTVRRAGAADAEVVADLIEDGFRFRPDGLDERTFAVVHSNQVIGTLAVSLKEQHAAVFGFVIAPQWRGRGIGRDVLARTCTTLREQGANQIRLEVDTDNEHALGLYTSLGFEPVITEDYYELPRLPSSA